jgi:lactate dehydrogenase-like 2-hydroxyacid dehydrogenase
MTWNVLTPDAQYEDDGGLEREAGKGELLFQIHHAGSIDKPTEEAYAGCEALLVWHEAQVNAALVARLKRCRIIVRAGVGFDNIDVDAAAAAGIPVSNTPDYGTAEVADHAMAMLLALERRLPGLDSGLGADPIGGFDYLAAPLPRRLRGRTIAILGLGRIGSAMALRAKAFGYHVVAFDPLLARGHEIALGVDRCDDLNTLLAIADVVSLHMPLSPGTRRIFDTARFAACKPGAMIVNTARGALLDLEDLYDALVSGHIFAAALDVLPDEPPSVPLPRLIAAHAERQKWLAGRLLLTPHSAWSSVESRRDARQKSVETVRLFLTGGELRNCVNLGLIEPSRRTFK